MKLLENKVSIVTGAAQGIGRGIAEKFAKEGSKVVIADINFDKAIDTAGFIEKEYGVDCMPVKVNVTKEKEIEEVMEKILNKHGKLDILVNNAGIQAPKEPFFEMSEETWDKTLSVNLKSVFLFSKAAARLFIEQGFGNIVNTASVAGPLLWEGSAHYIASKAGVAELTRVMALELSPYNIRVNAVGPGHVDTDINKEWLSQPGAREKVSLQVPLRRLALPKDLAGAYAFLASDKALYITGHILYVDGGLSQIK